MNRYCVTGESQKIQKFVARDRMIFDTLELLAWSKGCMGFVMTAERVRRRIAESCTMYTVYYDILCKIEASFYYCTCWTARRLFIVGTVSEPVIVSLRNLISRKLQLVRLNHTWNETKESIRACSKLRDDILTQWHKLGLQAVNSGMLEHWSFKVSDGHVPKSFVPHYWRLCLWLHLFSAKCQIGTQIESIEAILTF